MAERKDRPKPTLSPEALQRFDVQLRAIGPYDVSVGDDGIEIEWERLTGLPEVGFRVQVTFLTESDAGNIDLDEAMFALWDRFRAGFERHAASLGREMIAVYREVQPDLFEQDEFPPDLLDAGVLRLVRGTVVVKKHDEAGQVDYWLDVSFAAAWDGEHAWDFEYDAAADAFGEPSKG